MQEIWRKIFSTVWARVVDVLAGLLTVMLTAHWLGPEGRGIIVSSLAWVGLYSTFGAFGLGQVVIYRASKGQSEWLERAIGPLITVTLIVSILSWITVVLLDQLNSSIFGAIPRQVLACAYLMLPFLLWEQYSAPILTALNRVDLHNRAKIIGRTLGLVLVGTAYLLRANVALVTLCLVCVQAWISLGGTNFIFSKISIQKLIISASNFSELKSMLGSGLKLLPNSVGTYMILSTDIILINWYCGNAEAGFYQIATQIVSMLLLVPHAASYILYGNVASLGADHAWAEQKKVMFYVLILVLLSCLCAWYTSKEIIVLLAGAKFERSANALQLLLIAVPGMAFSILMAPQWIARGLFLQASSITVSCGLLNLIAGLLLIPHYQLFGSIYSTILTYLLSLAINGGMYLYVESRVRSAKRLEPAFP